jgi:hypothetical protein
MSNPRTFGIEAVDAAAAGGLGRVRGFIPAQPAVEECNCDGGGWIVTLDRDRYSSPGDAGMVRYIRCVCLDEALSTAR